MNTPKYKMKEIIDIDSLKEVQDNFAKITHLSTITVDENGTPIVSNSNFTDFCLLIRSSEEGYKRCMHCDSMGGYNSLKAGKPVIYCCHTGLTDSSAPIIVDNTYIGCMLCGQVIIKENISQQNINAYKLSKELNIPINDLKKAIEKLSVVKYSYMKDAADYLYIFANLIAKMGVANVVQTQLLNETREKMKLQQLVKDTNLKSLQSQINPHFLFNTLNTIARMALIENAPKTEELMYALSDILRYSLRNSDNLVTIETEINNIKKYLFIQYTRYNDRLKYEINISPKIMDFKIPVMTLQPIVENAIIHGLENKKEGGEIIISGNLVLNKFIILEIYDNGIGIDEKKLKLINEGTKSYDSSTGLGICNVSDRIKHYFGNNYGLEVKSKLNEGTTVTIKIPSIL